MTFAELYAEVAARGFDHITAARRKALVNRARSRLDGMHTWTYREASVQGVAPLSIPTLGIVEAVSNETDDYLLEPLGYADVVDMTGDISESGSPLYWYRATPAGDPVIATWRTNSDLIGVQHWAVTADLVADADTPESPIRFHGLIVDIAVQMAYRDSDNHQAAEALQVDIDRQTAQMVEELLAQQEPRFQRVTGASEDW